MQTLINASTCATIHQTNDLGKKPNANEKFIIQNVLNTNIQNVSLFIASLNSSKNKVQQESKEFLRKIKISAKYIECLCEESKKHYEEIKEKMEIIIKKGDEKQISLSQEELFKLMEETSNCTKFYEFSKIIESEIKKFSSIQEDMQFKEIAEKASKYIKEIVPLTQTVDLNESQISQLKTNITDNNISILKRKRLRSSDGESTNNPEELVEKDYQISLIKDNENQTAINPNNSLSNNNSLNNESDKPKRDRRSMKRELNALGLKGENGRKNKSTSSTANFDINNNSINKIQGQKNFTEEKNKNQTCLIDTEEKAKVNSKNNNYNNSPPDNSKIKSKSIPKKEITSPPAINKNINTLPSNITNKNSKKNPKLKDLPDKELKLTKKVYKNDEELNLSETVSSEESFKIEEEKRKLNSLKAKKKTSDKTYNQLVKITKYHNQIENNVLTLNSNLDASNGEAVCPIQLGIRENFNDEDEDENSTKNIILDKNEKLPEVIIKLTDCLAELCELIGKESNTINDYLMTNLENCLFIKRLYYSEFDLTNKTKKFNYEYLTKDNNLIEKIENFENVKLVIVRKGKQNINNLLKSMENFFKFYIKRKDVDGSAMIKGVLNCSFDKLQKYYNTYMRSFDYCEAIQIEVFLFKWDLFMDYNENYDKTNMTKKDIAELLNYGEILQNTRIYTKKRNLLREATNTNK